MTLLSQLLDSLQCSARPGPSRQFGPSRARLLPWSCAERRTCMHECVRLCTPVHVLCGAPAGAKKERGARTWGCPGRARSVGWVLSGLSGVSSGFRSQGSAGQYPAVVLGTRQSRIPSGVTAVARPRATFPEGHTPTPSFLHSCQPSPSCPFPLCGLPAGQRQPQAQNGPLACPWGQDLGFEAPPYLPHSGDVENMPMFLDF